MQRFLRKCGVCTCRIEYKVSFVLVECTMTWLMYFPDGQFGAMMDVSLTNEVWRIATRAFYAVMHAGFIGTCYSDIGYSEV